MQIEKQQGQYGFAIPAHISGEGVPPLNAIAAEVRDENTFVPLSRGFFSSKEGDSFAKAAENLYQSYVLPIVSRTISQRPIIAPWLASVLSSFVLIVRQDSTFDFYAGPPTFTIQGTLHGETKAGRAVTRDDFLDIKRMSFADIPLGTRDSVLLMFSDFLRHALIFDLGRHETELDPKEFSEYLARCYLEFIYPEVYASDPITEQIKLSGWFPFLGLQPTLYGKLYQNFRDSPLMRIKDAALQEFFEPGVLRKLSNKWWENALFGEHKDFVESALQS